MPALEPPGQDTAEALRRAEAACAQARATEAYTEFLHLRNRVIAHTDFSGKGHDAKYGHERELLGHVPVINTELHRVAGLEFVADHFEMGWTNDANVFWNSVRTKNGG